MGSPRRKRNQVKRSWLKKQKNKVLMGFQKELIENATDSEIRMKEILTEAGIRFKFQRKVKVDHQTFFPDFWLKDYNLVIEVDGGYHDSPEQQKKDMDRERLLLKLDDVRSIVRFRNEEVDGREKVLKRIARAACPFIKEWV